LEYGGINAHGVHEDHIQFIDETIDEVVTRLTTQHHTDPTA